MIPYPVGVTSSCVIAGALGGEQIVQLHLVIAAYHMNISAEKAAQLRYAGWLQPNRAWSEKAREVDK